MAEIDKIKFIADIIVNSKLFETPNGGYTCYLSGISNYIWFIKKEIDPNVDGGMDVSRVLNAYINTYKEPFNLFSITPYFGAEPAYIICYYRDIPVYN